MTFERLFSPIRVGPMLVPNRICETTNSINAGRHDGLPDEAFTEHHVAKARGGTGWIGNETWLLNSPLPDEASDEFFPGAAAIRMPMYWLPGFVERVGAFCEAVHASSAVAVFQLTHLNFTFAPSAVPVAESHDWIPHEVDDREIEFMIDTYATAAGRFAEARADGIEIHCAHETVPHLFLSPATNRRTDVWGGDARGRARLVVEILGRVRERIGEGMALGIRVGAEESRDGGYGAAELREMLAVIVETGLLDFVNVDVGHSWGVPYVMPSFYPAAPHAVAVKAIRELVAPVPVLLAGRVNDPVLAEELLAGETCDLVGMTRAGIADPEFPRKAREGRLEEIRRCIGCNRCIGESVHSYAPFPLRKPVCSVNPTAGSELLWKASYRAASPKRRVLVVGAGAAGLEAARVSAMRGHEVIVLERRDEPGGQVLLASRAPGRGSFADFIRYEQTQMKLLGVDVRLGAVAGAEDVLELEPDAVVCATGSVPIVPDVAGVDGPGVVQAWDVLEGLAETGERVAVISLEDHMETPNVADYLATRGRRVEVFHKWLRIGSEVDRYTIGAVMARLEEGGVVLHNGLRPRRIAGGTVELASAHTGAHRVFEGFDTVVLACGSRPDTGLYRSLEGSVGRLFLAGSAWVPRLLAEATRHGMQVGLEV